MEKIKNYILSLSKRRVAGWFYSALIAVQYLGIDPVIYSDGSKNITLSMSLAVIPLVLLGKDALDKKKRQ